MASVVEIRNLRVFYKTRWGYIKAVDDVSLEIRQGETLGLVGESGCGKSTLGRALLGILPAGTSVRGEILYGMPSKERREVDTLELELRQELKEMVDPSRLANLDIRSLEGILQEVQTRSLSVHCKESLNRLLELKRAYDITAFPKEALRKLRGERMVLIFQDPMSRLDPLMTIRDHFVELITAHHDVHKDEAEAKTTRALGSVGIPPSRLKNYPHEFSGGMRQRIMIAMALVMNPEILIADEPTTSLDVLVEAQILRLVEELKQSLSMALFLITHNLGVVAETCDRVGVMYAGKLVEVAEVSELFSKPRHPYTEGLLSSVIHLET
ncbi:MAG: ABC transporter ATP-binding protein, partial [Thermoplasmata archaeon]